MGSPKSFRSTFTEIIVPSRVNTGGPIIIIGVNTYIRSNAGVDTTILGFHQQAKTELPLCQIG